jgi:hypothetical protein
VQLVTDLLPGEKNGPTTGIPFCIAVNDAEIRKRREAQAIHEPTKRYWH